MNSDSAATGTPRSTKSMLEVSVPPNLTTLQKARVLMAEPKVRINELTEALYRDPSIVLELLKIANSMQFSAGRPPTLTLKAVLERLGTEVTIQALEELKAIPQLSEEDGASYLDEAKERCFLCSQVARVISEVASKSLAEDCEIAALFSNMGDILAVINFKSQFVKFAKELNRVKLLYRLEKDFKFDPHKMGLAYLRKIGVPEGVLFGIDPEAQLKTQGRGPMKPICAAAAEMVTQFQADKWDKLAPGATLPPKSPVRMLGLNDSQYANVYEKATAIFVPSRG